MKITKQNIADFITYLYQNRKQQIPPKELLHRWQALSDDEIDRQLTGLFASWGMTEQNKQDQIIAFYRRSLYSPAPEVLTTSTPASAHSVPPQEVNPPALTPMQRTSRTKWPLWIALSVLLIASIFLGVKYMQFSNLDYIYTITDNVSVRNEDKDIVATMDLFEVKKAIPSYQKLKVFDKKIYYRSIDNSDTKFPFRKVIVGNADFWDFMFRQNDITGYVNTNYVVDNQNEFNLYQNAFKEVKANKMENANLKAIYRKIIIGSMGMDPTLSDKYIVTNTANLSRTVIDKTYAIIKQTIIENVKYVIIAGLSDGNYYKFEGDIKENVFAAPQRVEVDNGIDGSVPLTGSYRFYNKDKQIYLYDCKANLPLSFVAVRDNKGYLHAFEYIPPADTQSMPSDTINVEE